MHKLFTWEHGPFEMCPSCQEAGTFGILSVGGHGVTKRCTRCRYSHTEGLPTLNKKVVYLDQFVFSELHKLRMGTRKNDKWTTFWSEVSQLLNKAMLLQQLVLPHSNIHHRETIVSPFPGALRTTQETIGGDIRLRHTNDIQLRQTEAFARAFFADEEPAIKFDAGEAIDGLWNEWLPDMQVTVGTDWSSFVPETRLSRLRKIGRFSAVSGSF